MKNYKTPTEAERMKYEIAMELGLIDKVLEVGWAGLSAAETGRIGGILSRRMRKAGDCGQR